MADWFTLSRAMDEALRAMREQTGRLAELGRVKAQAEYEYRGALAVKVLQLRDEKGPATIINDVARGDKKVSLLRLKRDIAEAELDAAKELVMSAKKEVDVYREQMAREWSQGGEPW